jgi:preprotein translocase subunit SecA
MKQIDNRQKQQIVMRAQKAFLGGKNPIQHKDKEEAPLPPEKPEVSPAAGPEIPSTVHRAEPKVGRNDPCPCGSGKKYKKCCLHA